MIATERGMTTQDKNLHCELMEITQRYIDTAIGDPPSWAPAKGGDPFVELDVAHGNRLLAKGYPVNRVALSLAARAMGRAHGFGVIANLAQRT